MASEIGLDAFGWNIENDRMAETVGAAIAQSRGVERISIGVQAYDFGAGAVRARLKDGRVVSARLAIGADGRDSKARRDAGLEARIHRYPQSALTARLAHRLPHERLFDRIPHPRRPVYPRSPAGRRDRAQPLEPRLGYGARGRAPARGAR